MTCQMTGVALLGAAPAQADVVDQWSYQEGQKWSGLAVYFMKKMGQAGYPIDKTEACLYASEAVFKKDPGKYARLSATQGFMIDDALDGCRDRIR